MGIAIYIIIGVVLAALISIITEVVLPNAYNKRDRMINLQEDAVKHEFTVIESETEICSNCKGDGEECDNGLSWVYCETRANNLELFEGDCGELLGCDRFRKL